MNKRIRKYYMPMTETGFYILFSLQKERHGYHIMKYVKDLTNDEVILGAGTVYTTLSKMEQDDLICFTRAVDKRKYYKLTDLGKEILKIELKRIERLYKNSKEIHYEQ